MINVRQFSLIIGLCTVFISVSVNAEGFIKKEVYSFKDKSGNSVFTDRQPNKKQAFKTQTIEAANSTANTLDELRDYDDRSNSKHRNYSNQTYLNNNSITQPQTVRIIVEEGRVTKKKYYKKKRSLSRCKSYKKKLTYFSNKMKAGYKSTEYKKLEANRKKYKNLLFNNCETKTFND